MVVRRVRSQTRTDASTVASSTLNRGCCSAALPEVPMGVAALNRSPSAGDRRAYTFQLDAELVEQARREVGEPDVVRSIEAALAAAIDYHLWVREVSTGGRDVLS
jgi:hypothetical protein